MLLKLSKNAFVRQYGEFTYVLERIKCYDQMFKDAEVFMRWITRTPMEKSEILKNICGVYVGADADVTIFDYDKIQDKATFEHPAAAPEGIEYVLIGGEIALEHGEIIRNDCGKAVRK